MSNELSIFGSEKNESLPAFMQGEQDTGIGSAGDFIVPPRIKVVQAMSDIKSDFDEGAVVMMPQRVLIADIERNEKGRPTGKGAPFIFTPILFWPEWVAWNPLQMKGTLPAIRERTLDPEDPMVVKCRDSKLWHEPCPENTEYNIRYCEHLNFLIILHEGPAKGTPIVVSFARAEHSRGTNFCALLKMRNGPIYGMVFQGQVDHREGPKGSWEGIDVTNPPEGVSPWIQDESTYKQLKELHEHYKDAHDARVLRPDYEDDSEPAADNGTEF